MPNLHLTKLNIGALIANGVLKDNDTEATAPVALVDHEIEIDFAELTNYGSDTSIECPRGVTSFAFEIISPF